MNELQNPKVGALADEFALRFRGDFPYPLFLADRWSTSAHFLSRVLVTFLSPSVSGVPRPSIEFST